MGSLLLRLAFLALACLELSTAQIDQVVVSPSDTQGTGYWVTWTTPGPGQEQLLLTNTATGTTSSFLGTSRAYSTFGYTSGTIHKCNCSGLRYSTNYTYTLTHGIISKRGWFVTAPAPGSPVTLAFFGDHGTTVNSRNTLARVRSSRAQAVVLVGDFSYANGRQGTWDTWQRTWSAYLGHLPLHFCYGNHESIQQEPAGFLAADSRFAGPQFAAGASTVGNAVSSTSIGAVHLVSLNCYNTTNAFQNQLAWLKSDLTKVDRTKTPFVVVAVHCPWYNTHSVHYLEGETMRVALESTLRAARIGTTPVKPVDLVVSGHVHAYERFDNIFEYKKDPCGPVYITVGTGGTSSTSTTAASSSLSLYRGSTTGGYGTLQVINSTTAVWRFYRNSQASPSDEVLVVSRATVNTCRNPVPSRVQYTTTTPPPWP